jgi:hypothetical protein
MVRNAAFRRVELAARRDVQALAESEEPAGMDAAAWSAALQEYFAVHAAIGTGAAARSGARFTLVEGPRAWHVRQVLDDPEGDGDFAVVAEIELASSDEAGSPAWRTLRVEQG